MSNSRHSCRGWMLGLVGLSLLGASGDAVHAAEPMIAKSIQEELTAGLEQVYVFRTTRTTRTRGATPECQAAGFDSTAEDHYDLWSVASAANSSRVTDGHVRGVGEFRACFGAIAAGKPFQMFAAGKTDSIAWTGRGECSPVSAQPPETAVRAFNCNLRLEGLPEGYAGGWLTSSTLAPVLGATAPPDAHVRGYMSTSIVTLRLWRVAAAAPPR